jgi:hypothetical protein
MAATSTDLDMLRSTDLFERLWFASPSRRVADAEIDALSARQLDDIGASRSAMATALRELDTLATETRFRLPL